MMINESKNIYSAGDFEEYCCETLDALCESIISNPKFVREVEEGDMCDEGITFIYRPRAVRLIEDFKHRLFKVAEKYGYANDIDIYSHYYQEF